MLPLAQAIWRRMVGCLVNNELSRSWPDLHYPGICLEGWKKATDLRAEFCAQGDYEAIVHPLDRALRCLHIAGFYLLLIPLFYDHLSNETSSLTIKEEHTCKCFKTKYME
jgi:hypothetical protein